MSAIERLTVERRNKQGTVPEWPDALTTDDGRLSLPSSDQDSTSCVATSGLGFSGCVEYGIIGDMVLAKVATTSSRRLAYSLRYPPLGAPPPIVLILQLNGNCLLEQCASSWTLRPNDWCLLDPHQPFHISSFRTDSENISLRLKLPSDPGLLRLISPWTTRRWDGATGAWRILGVTVREAFDQMNYLRNLGGSGLQRAVVELMSDAFREQLEVLPPLTHQDLQRYRIKSFIDSQLDDPDLSVVSIADSCGISIRSVHRSFMADPAGSVSHYVWGRRLSQCAADLRDFGQAHKPITEICFSRGFNSTSHFSRLFKERFGVTPREYRLAPQERMISRISSTNFEVPALRPIQ